MNSYQRIFKLLQEVFSYYTSETEEVLFLVCILETDVQRH